MIKRKLNESDNITLHVINESFEKTGDLSKKQLNKLYKIIFEDVKSVRPLWIYYDQQETPRLEELYSEVKFNNGETHYFYEDYRDKQIVINEVNFSDKEKEVFDYNV